MTQQDNIQIVRHIFEAWDEHDVGRYGKSLDEKHVVESDTLPAPLTGRDAASVPADVRERVPRPAFRDRSDLRGGRLRHDPLDGDRHASGGN